MKFRVLAKAVFFMITISPRLKSRSTTTFFCLLLCHLFLSSTAFAQITVNTAIVHFKYGQRPVINVEVGNSSEHTAYVVVQVMAVPDPASDSSHTIETEELLVSPRNFSVEANGQRTVRLLLRKPPGDSELVYRVSFIPQDRGFGDEVEHNLGGGATAVIRVLSGMGILVFADPINPTGKLEWTRAGDLLTFTNPGNVHVFLGDGQSCHGERNSEGCEKLPAKRLYAGETFEVTLPKNKTAFYLIKKGASGDYQRIEIKPEN